MERGCYVSVSSSHLAAHELRSLFVVLLCALLLPELLPGEGGTAGGGLDVGVDDLSPFLCPREAERGDHGQEDLVLHPREKPTSG